MLDIKQLFRITLAFWANWSTILLGQHAVVKNLQPMVLNRGSYQARAIQIAFRVLPIEQAREWISVMSKNAAHVRAVIAATGVLGDPHAVNWLIGKMADPLLARLAAESFTNITGVDLVKHQLHETPHFGEVQIPIDANDAHVDMMACTVFSNSRGVAHKDSGSISLVFPDVCLTPIGKAVVPIPYPNLGQASDTIKGPKSVTTDGAMPMVKEALYSKSSGDEPGVRKGVVSGAHKDVCEFMMYSFDVKFEGRNVCRLGDPLFHNKKNIVG